MDTPVVDFLRQYANRGAARLHMPGHKGRGPLGCEALDITEVEGADSLYEAAGIIARSEQNAAALFGAARTLYSAGGSSQCVGAMLHLALVNRAPGAATTVLAARNVHRSFIHAAALLGLEVEWLWPEDGRASLCACPVTAEELERALSAMERPPCGVYITSPDYLGNLQDVAALAAAAHRHGVPLLVDNAHGAYLHFLENPSHPLDLGADLCCDSAHKTLPVLTGGACLHVGRSAPAGLGTGAKGALALFGSTSPSYLILASLDECNRWLAGEGPAAIRQRAAELAALKGRLSEQGWVLAGEEPLKLTIDAAPSGWEGRALADGLRGLGVEPEYAEAGYVTLMVSAHTAAGELARVEEALGTLGLRPALGRAALPPSRPERAMSIREAILAPHERVAAAEALGWVCAAPTVACPPAIPIVMAGERIGGAEAALFAHYGVEQVDVVLG